MAKAKITSSTTDKEIKLGEVPMSTDIVEKMVTVTGERKPVKVELTKLNGKEYWKYVKDGATYLVTEISPGVYGA